MALEELRHGRGGVAQGRVVVDLGVSVLKLDVATRHEGEIVFAQFIDAYRAEEFGLGIARAVRAFGLPSVIDAHGMGYLLVGEESFLLLLSLDSMLRLLAQVHKEDLARALAQLAPVPASSTLVLVEDPQCDGYIGGVEQFTRQHHDGLHLIGLDKLLPNSHRVAIAQGAIGQEEASHTPLRFQFGENVQYPRIVGIALGWQAVVCPTCIVAQLGTVPLLEVEGRIRHDIVAGQAPVHILREVEALRSPRWWEMPRIARFIFASR